MKNTHICPKCQGSDIVFAKGEEQAYGIGNNVRAGVFKQVITNRYICCTCGYSEEWLDLQDVPRVKKYCEKKNRI
ncbi:MAG: hypothetical protein E7595_04800 [Ruminococcaceae bacterium]|nr:hypothetical protein [Oscillospiraceae bacterium]